MAKEEPGNNADPTQSQRRRDPDGRLSKGGKQRCNFPTSHKRQKPDRQPAKEGPGKGVGPDKSVKEVQDKCHQGKINLTKGEPGIQEQSQEIHKPNGQPNQEGARRGTA